MRRRPRKDHGRWEGRPARRRREFILSKHPLCSVAGCYMLAAELDHIVPLHMGGTEDESNLQPICLDHHKQKTARELRISNKRKRRKYPPEWQRFINEITQKEGK